MERKPLIFDDLQAKNAWLYMFIIGVCVFIFSLCIQFDVVSLGNPGLEKAIIAIGYLGSMLMFLRTLRSRRMVYWNKKGIGIRINSFWEKNLKFDEVINYTLHDNIFVVTDYCQKATTIDLSTVCKEDQTKILEIFQQNAEIRTTPRKEPYYDRGVTA